MIIENKQTLATAEGASSDVEGTPVKPEVGRDAAAFICRLSVTLNSGTSLSVVGKVYHAPTEDGEYTLLTDFDEITDTTTEPAEVHIPPATTAVFPFIKGVIEISGTGVDVDAVLDLYHS